LFLSFITKQDTEGQPAKFRDVWREIHPSYPGLTFSLMPFKDAEHFVPSTGLESRPDRYIDTKKRWKDGNRYRERETERARSAIPSTRPIVREEIARDRETERPRDQRPDRETERPETERPRDRETERDQDCCEGEGPRESAIYNRE
jgi:hypothetical protein